MKTELTVNIKFRDFEIRDMKPSELRELRDVLNSLLGERVVERHEYVPYWPKWTYTYGESGTGIGINTSEIVITCNT